MSNRREPEVGSRVMLSSRLGTIRYVGPVSGYQGRWLGVEWDEPSRGKNDGSKDGKRYFTCRAPGTPASFIRDEPSLSYGVTFLDALEQKYIGLSPTEDVNRNESVLLGSSRGAILVEAPRMSKVRRRLARVEDLKVASLDGEGVTSAGVADEVRSRDLAIEQLDLSRSLLSTWRETMVIIAQLPRLNALGFNSNRCFDLEDVLRQEGGHIAKLDNLKSLAVNNCMLDASDVLNFACIFPSLKNLELASNSLTSLNRSPLQTVFSALESLNLASNSFQDWEELALVLSSLTGLESLSLAENFLSEIRSPPLADPPPSLSQLSTLSLSSNRLGSWGSLDSLSAWCPSLKSLNIQENPVVAAPETANCSRQLTVARFPLLLTCDGSGISSSERKDAELFYLSFIVKDTAPEIRATQHPQWARLCAKYGSPDEATQPVTDNLLRRLISLRAMRIATPPGRRMKVNDMSPISPTVELKILPSMVMKTLRVKVLRALKLLGSPDIQIRMWALIYQARHQGSVNDSVATVEINLTEDISKEINSWGLDDGDGVAVLVTEPI